MSKLLDQVLADARDGEALRLLREAAVTRGAGGIEVRTYASRRPFWVWVRGMGLPFPSGEGRTIAEAADACRQSLAAK